MATNIRILVCGGRNYAERVLVYSVLEAHRTKYQLITILHGKCKTGADALADEWCFNTLTPVERFPANWRDHGRAAGPIRNGYMLREGKPNRFIAFPGGNGTADMIKKLKAANIPGIIIEEQ